MFSSRCLFASGSCGNNADVNIFEIKSLSDRLILQGYHWAAEQPVAAMSLVHGFGEHAGRYLELVQHLNSRGISVVAVDLRGHGRTVSPRGVARQYDDIYGDVRTLIDETRRLYPALPRFLFGHSMGGGLVLHHGMNHQSDSLSGYLVSAPLIHAKRQLPFYLRAAVKLMRKMMPSGTMPISVSGTKISSLVAQQELYDNDPLNHNRLGFGLGVDMIEVGETVLKNAAQWDKPLRLWHSKADQITAYDAAKKFALQANHCEFTSFEDVQHEMHHDVVREEVHSLMVEFILQRLA